MTKIFLNGRIIAKVLLTMGIMVGCNDQLDQTVNGSLPTEEFYGSVTDLDNALTATYDQYSVAFNQPWPSVYLVREIMSDDVNAGGSGPTDQPTYQQMDNFRHDAQGDHIRDSWGNLYRTIYRANMVINKSEGLQGADVPRMVAEARVLRAFAYMDLVSLWGGVPIVEKELTPAEFTNGVRASKEEVLTFIENDLLAAIPSLPARSALTAGSKFRVTSGAARGLLGKAYLYHEQWGSALDAFEAVIASNEYDLEDEIDWVFDRNNEFGKESLFEVNFITPTPANDWGNFPWGNYSEDNVIIQLMGPRSDYFKQAAGDSLIGGWGFEYPTEEIWNAFVNAGDNTRRTRVVQSEAELKASGGNWVTADGSVPDAWDYEGFFRRKYGSFTTQTGGSVLELNYATNFVLLRYADILLMAAEAAYRDGDDVAALGYLNEVRQRPGTNLPPVVATGDALFDAIVLERRLELAFEGHRFADLVRWGLADDELSDLGFTAGKHERLPIPAGDVAAGKLVQNDGY